MYSEKLLIVNVISTILFVVILVNWYDLNIQNILSRHGIQSSLSLGILLLLIAVLGILIFKFVTKLAGLYIFILLSLVVKSMLRYTELFTVVTQPQTTQPLDSTDPNFAEIQDFLLKQIASDPNTTEVDKQVIVDITKKYFKNSSKLAEMRDFNESTKEYNPLPGLQQITGSGLDSNNH